MLLSFSDWQNASSGSSQVAYYFSCIKKKKKAEVSSSISPHHHYILTQKTPYNSIAGKGMYKNKPQDKEIGEKKYFQHLK